MLFGLRAKAWLAVAGTIALTILGLIVRLKFVTDARDRAEVKSNTLKATVRAEGTKQRIIKEQRQKRASRRLDIIDQIRKKKEEEKKVGDPEDEKFTGIDNLTNSDKWSK